MKGETNVSYWGSHNSLDFLGKNFLNHAEEWVRISVLLLMAPIALMCITRLSLLPWDSYPWGQVASKSWAVLTSLFSLTGSGTKLCHCHPPLDFLLKEFKCISSLPSFTRQQPPSSVVAYTGEECLLPTCTSIWFFIQWLNRYALIK